MVTEFKLYLDEDDLKAMKNDGSFCIDTDIDPKVPIHRITLVWDPNHIYCDPVDSEV